MTVDEIRDFLDKDGVIDCEHVDTKTKIEALEALESIGYEIGFDKYDSQYYKFIYYDYPVGQIHMYGNDYGNKKISVDDVMSCILAELPEPCSLSDLYDWIA